MNKTHLENSSPPRNDSGESELSNENTATSGKSSLDTDSDLTANSQGSFQSSCPLETDSDLDNIICQTCHRTWKSVEKFKQHSHGKSPRYLKLKHHKRHHNTERKTNRKNQEEKVDREEPPYDDLSKWTIDGFEPQHRCGICLRPFHCILAKAFHGTICNKTKGTSISDCDSDDKNNTSTTS